MRAVTLKFLGTFECVRPISVRANIHPGPRLFETLDITSVTADHVLASGLAKVWYT